MYRSLPPQLVDVKCIFYLLFDRSSKRMALAGVRVEPIVGPQRSQDLPKRHCPILEDQKGTLNFCSRVMNGVSQASANLSRRRIALDRARYLGAKPFDSAKIFDQIGSRINRLAVSRWSQAGVNVYDNNFLCSIRQKLGHYLAKRDI